jgi:hypothetical protein
MIPLTIQLSLTSIVLRDLYAVHQSVLTSYLLVSVPLLCSDLNVYAKPQELSPSTNTTCTLPTKD